MKTIRLIVPVFLLAISGFAWNVQYNYAAGQDLSKHKTYRWVQLKAVIRFMRLATVYLLAFVTLPSLSRAQVPVFAISRDESSIKFHVKASVDLTGTFEKWEASARFTSRELESAVLDVKIQADSVNTGSGMKDGKLKSKDFFNVKEDPFITFHTTKIEQTGPDTFNFLGNFTIRGVSKPESLTFTSIGKGTGVGSIKGTMAFDRKDYGMTSGIPFIKIADRVEVIVDLHGRRTSGPPPIFKQ